MIRRILAVGEPQKIVLFGSRARGDARADSDYDLLLVEPSVLPRHKRAARYRRALTGLAGAKDILVWTPEEVAQWRDVPNAFVTAAVQEGVVLYERPLHTLPALDRYDFSETTDYGVLVRYDLEFWPDQNTADDAVAQAEQVFELMVNALPPECRP